MYHFLKFIFRAISCIPLRVLYIVSDLMYFVVYYVVRYRRKIVRRNLTESFPQMPEQQLKRIEKDFYHFLVDLIFESLKLCTISKKEMMRRLKFTNIDFVNGMLSSGESVSVFLGHYGNWEWVSSMPLWLTKDCVASQIYHKQRSSSAMDKVLLWMRSRMGANNIEMHDTVRFVLNATRSGIPNIIGFIADQSPRFQEAKHFLEFLNHTAPVLTGSEKITKRCGWQAVFLSVKRVRRGYYECEFQSLHPNPKSLPDYELTSLYYQRLEQEITRRPELYLWTHNRFKHAIRK